MAVVVRPEGQSLPVVGVQLRFALDALKGVRSPYSDLFGVQMAFAMSILRDLRR